MVKCKIQVSDFTFGGEVVSVMDGPNVTLMRSMVLEECDKEALVMAGARRRHSIAITEAVPSSIFYADNNEILRFPI